MYILVIPALDTRQFILKTGKLNSKRNCFFKVNVVVDTLANTSQYKEVWVWEDWLKFVGDGQMGNVLCWCSQTTVYMLKIQRVVEIHIDGRWLRRVPQSSRDVVFEWSQGSWLFLLLRLLSALVDNPQCMFFLYICLFFSFSHPYCTN